MCQSWIRTVHIGRSSELVQLWPRGGVPPKGRRASVQEVFAWKWYFIFGRSLKDITYFLRPLIDWLIEASPSRLRIWSGKRQIYSFLHALPPFTLGAQVRGWVPPVDWRSPALLIQMAGYPQWVYRPFCISIIQTWWQPDPVNKKRPPGNNNKTDWITAEP